jgi:hypothetical protein
LQLQLEAECVGVSAAQITCTSHLVTKYVDRAQFEQFWQCG